MTEVESKMKAILERLEMIESKIDKLPVSLKYHFLAEAKNENTQKDIELIDLKEVMEIIPLKRMTFYRMRECGKLNSTTINNRVYYYKEEILALAKSGNFGTLLEKTAFLKTNKGRKAA